MIIKEGNIDQVIPLLGDLEEFIQKDNRATITERIQNRDSLILIAYLEDQAAGIKQSPSELTGRELEVLLLIAEGLSNAKIAEKLVISEKTVKSHVSSILSKLHLDDRTQAAIYALKHNLGSGRS